jgi:hypothetical protein
MIRVNDGFKEAHHGNQTFAAALIVSGQSGQWLMIFVTFTLLGYRQWRIPFWPADEKVKQRADEMQEHNRQHPADFFAVGQPFVPDGINEHPNPECKHQQTDGDQK